MERKADYMTNSFGPKFSTQWGCCLFDIYTIPIFVIFTTKFTKKNSVYLLNKTDTINAYPRVRKELTDEKPGKPGFLIVYF